MDEGANSTGSRSRRKVSRVNYAEDSNVEEVSERSSSISSVSTAATGSTGTGGPGRGRKKNTEAKRERDSVTDNFPMNWQRRILAGERLSATMDYSGARMADGILYFKDGTTLEPDGKLRVSEGAECVYANWCFRTCLCVGGAAWGAVLYW
jgi:hypothetical protein